MVVSTLEWPIRSWTVRMSVPFWSNEVAKLWRIECEPAFLVMSALRTALELALERVLVEMVPGELAGARVGADVGGRKHVLPAPFRASPGVFACQCFRQMGFAKADGDVLAVLLAGFGERREERRGTRLARPAA